MLVSCNADEPLTGKEEAEKAIIAFLELCRKGRFDEACESYLAEGIPKPNVLREKFDYKMLNITKDKYSETRYEALLRLEFEDGMVLNAALRFDTERDRIDSINVTVRDPGNYLIHEDAGEAGTQGCVGVLGDKLDNSIGSLANILGVNNERRPDTYLFVEYPTNPYQNPSAHPGNLGTKSYQRL